MIPAPFEYEVAETQEHAFELLSGDEDAKAIAGGHSLVPAMKLRLARPTLVVDIARLPDLAYVRDAGEQIAIGALTRLHDVHHDPLLQEHCPLVSTTAGMIGDPQVRHRGTIGGTLAHGDPASDLSTIVLTLDAELVIRGSSGERVVPATDFFTGIFRTAIWQGELLTEIRVPKLAHTVGWSYVKFHRRAQDWATVGVAAVLDRDNGSVTSAAIGLTQMGGTPLRATAAEQALTTGGSTADAAAVIAEGTDPSSDVAASAEFRVHLAGVIGARAIEEALNR